MSDTQYLAGNLPHSFFDIESSLDVGSAQVDEFDIAQPLVYSSLSSVLLVGATDIQLDDITQFYPPDISPDVDNPGGVPSSTSRWGRIIIHIEDEIILIEGFTAGIGTAGTAHVADRAPLYGRGILNTTAAEHPAGARVAGFISSGTLELITTAIKATQEELITLVDHDHTGIYGAQIPSAGIANLAITSGKLAALAVTAGKLGLNAVTYNKIATDNSPSATLNFLGWNDSGSTLTWLDAEADKFRINSADSTPQYFADKISATSPIILTINDLAGVKSAVLSLSPTYTSNFFNKTTDDTDDIIEGATNLFFYSHNLLSTQHGDTTAHEAVKGDLVYSAANGTWSALAGGANGRLLMMVAGKPQWNIISTDDIVEGSNLYFLDQRVFDALVSGHISTEIEIDLYSPSGISFDLIDNSIYEVKLFIDNDPSGFATSDYYLRWNHTLGKMQWSDISSGGLDEKVKADGTDPTGGYLDAKVDDATIEVNTVSHVLKVKSISASEIGFDADDIPDGTTNYLLNEENLQLIFNTIVSDSTDIRWEFSSPVGIRAFIEDQSIVAAMFQTDDDYLDSPGFVGDLMLVYDEGADTLTWEEVGQIRTTVDDGTLGFLDEKIDSSFEIVADKLAIAEDGVFNYHINWGTGLNQVSTTYIPEGTRLFFTDLRAETAIDNILANTSTIGWTYTPTSVLSAVVRNYSLNKYHFNTLVLPSHGQALTWDSSYDKLSWVNVQVNKYVDDLYEEDVIAGVIAVNHALNSIDIGIFIYDEYGNKINVDDIEVVDEDNINIDVSSYGLLPTSPGAGWRLVIFT